MPTAPTVIVPAAGTGQRFGAAENKVFAIAAGHPLLWWSVSALCTHPDIRSVVVVTARGESDRARDILSEFSMASILEAGGSTRAESVLNGLRAIDNSATVLVHDAARPAVSHALISRVIEGVEKFDAAIPGLRVGDTLKRADSDGNVIETVSRHDLWSVQTPQGARADLLLSAYERVGDSALRMTDEAGILEAAGVPVKIIEGDADNVKVTTPTDLERVARNLKSRNSKYGIRTGFGYDVHAFVVGRDLWLGGVRIPYTRGLAGHSDADVILHAVCDALLGAAGLGDIGALFPDTDSANRDRPSVEFLRAVYERIRSDGWTVSNIDVTLLAEEPRISDYRNEICAVIADCVSAAPPQVNIKATTSEGMGFVGRREGIACWAIATLVAE